MRKLVTIQTIDKLTPIKNADRVESARVLGWNVVVGKDTFKEGDKAVFFEIDSMLPDTIEAFDNFQSRGKKSVLIDLVEISGHVVTTAKIRGVVSQGLIMKLSEFGLSDEIEVGTEVTNELGVIKWEEPVPDDKNIIGAFDTRFSPKTVAIRAQSISENWEEIVSLEWEAMVKIDGASQTILNDNGNIRIFSRNWELSKEVVGMEVAKSSGILDVVSETPGISVQFELAGPGISQNRMKLKELKGYVFAVWLDGHKLHRDKWDSRLLKTAVPLLNDWEPSGTLDEMIEKVNGIRGHITKDILDEGVVFHLKSEDIPEWLNRNASFKIINNKYILKHGI